MKMPSALYFRLGVTVTLLGCGSAPPPESGVRRVDPWLQQLAIEFGRLPDSIPTRWRGLIGEYGPDTTTRWFALERDRRMYVLDHRGNYVPLAETNDSTFEAPRATVAVSGEVRFHRDDTGRATSIQVADMVMARRVIEPPSGANQLRITPVRPIDDLRREALAATPPAETGSFRAPELVEVAPRDSTIRLEVRYATTNNFLGARVYEEARVFLQRPAAEALLRVNRTLRPFGYGLLLHDGYRPWYVTRIFWDAVPADKKWLVADPAQGSKHNRGAAIDLTMYDLETRQSVEMPSTYDESTSRAHADYPGGTTLQRYHRALLRRAMEHEGFIANPQEWWHFDYKDWKSYPISNVPFASVQAR
jgi:D-alanyl-D-alanine dipeptidase